MGLQTVLRLDLRIFSQTLFLKRILEHYFSTLIRYNEAAQTNGDLSNLKDASSAFAEFACYEATPMNYK